MPAPPSLGRAVDLGNFEDHFDFDGDAERCLAVGMNDYVTKPIDLGKLNDALDRARVELFPADREVG